MLDIFSQYLRKVVIDGEEHKKLVLYFLGMVVIFVLTEMAVAKVIDINAILRGEA